MATMQEKDYWYLVVNSSGTVVIKIAEFPCECNLCWLMKFNLLVFFECRYIFITFQAFPMLSVMALWWLICGFYYLKFRISQLSQFVATERT